MRRIFIGSSSEFIEQARQVASLLKGLSNIEPIMWDTVFEPGLLTLQAIEKMMDDVSGAVLIATPDDRIQVRGQLALVPRMNVVYELGLLSSRLGRSQVALCKYDEVTLPTDLAGFTYIGMGRAPAPGTKPRLPPGASKLIRKWAERLAYRVADTPKTALLHGYSGRWRGLLRFTKWAGHYVNPPSMVQVDSLMDFVIPTKASDGYGCIHGQVTVDLRDPANPTMELYHARINVADRITEVHCRDDGGVRFISEGHSRLFLEERGNSSNLQGAVPNYPGPRVFRWELMLSQNDASKLTGTYCRIGDDRDAATIEMRKVH